jgi:hypothetical protein
MHTTASSPAPAPFRQVVGGFVLAAAGVLLVMATDLLLPNFSQTGMQQNALRLVVLALILYGAWIGLTRAGYAGGRRLTAWLAIAVPLLMWQAVVWWLAIVGAFQTRVGPLPLLPLAIVLPLLIGLPVLLRSRTVGLVLDATPPAWLVGLQVYRIFGSVFLVGWLAGNLPAIFALPAGAGDTLVGLLALPVALLLQSGARGSRLLAIGWNVLGILDLVDAVTLGALTTPGPQQLIVPDRINLVAAYPLVLIPAFAVPLSLLLHSVSLRQLRRIGRRKVNPDSQRNDTVDCLSTAPAAA